MQLRATGSVVKFNGFLTLYDEGRDDERSEDEEGNAILPDVAEDEALERREVIPEQHFTEPPPRYSEASLVKKLEELGIGRPSTYASIIEVLQRRNYVRIDRKRFIPEDRGRIVTAFLQTYFPRYVEYNFTAHLEEELDDISDGKIDWRQVLREFWKRLLRRRRRDQGPARQRGARQARRGARPALLPGQRQWRQEPARLPVLRQRPARPEARQVRRLHRLLELSGVPLHPQARHRRSRGGRRIAAPTSTGRRCWASIRRPASR